ncbi:hypothetical protein M0Q28_06770 [Patescibacteria group bacterium]|jgi:hypothetical protein|nr:hypothetical protein [Patescibacteria group bacterium]
MLIMGGFIAVRENDEHEWPGYYSAKKKGYRTPEEKARDEARFPKKKGLRTPEEKARDSEEVKRRHSTKSTRNEPPMPYNLDEDRRRQYEKAPPLSRCRCGTWTTDRPCQDCRLMTAEEYAETVKHKNTRAIEDQRMAYGNTERLMTYFNRGEVDLVDLIEKYIPPPILDGRESEEN